MAFNKIRQDKLEKLTKRLKAENNDYPSAADITRILEVKTCQAYHYLKAWRAAQQGVPISV